MIPFPEWKLLLLFQDLKNKHRKPPVDRLKFFQVPRFCFSQQGKEKG